MSLLNAKRSETKDFGEFVGFFTAHFLWQTEGHESVVPMVAVEDKKGPSMERFEGVDYAKAAEKAHAKYDRLKGKNTFTLLALDGYTAFKGTKYEAVIIQTSLRHAEKPHKLIFAIPYAWTDNGQKIYNIQVEESDLPDTNNFLKDLEKGTARHAEGYAFWKAHKAK